MDEKHVYDTIIIGAGPAGLTAGIYAGRAAMDTLIIEKDQIGGQVTTTSVVWNYPAVKDVDGTKLVNLMQEQVNEFGVKIIKDDVVSFDLTGDVRKVSGKKDYFAPVSYLLLVQILKKQVLKARIVFAGTELLIAQLAMASYLAD